MEERKKIRAIGLFFLILLWIMLLLLSLLAANPCAWIPKSFRWGVYLPGDDAVFLPEVQAQITADDLLFCDRLAAPEDLQPVVYDKGGTLYVDCYLQEQARPSLCQPDESVCPEKLSYHLSGAGRWMRLLFTWKWVIWGATAGILLLPIVLFATAERRWEKRQQRLMRERFRQYGDQYQKQDEERDY